MNDDDDDDDDEYKRKIIEILEKTNLCSFFIYLISKLEKRIRFSKRLSNGNLNQIKVLNSKFTSF